MNLPPTSLIIASRNRPEMLKETVDSILDGTELPKEIVIVDQSDMPHPLVSEMKTTRGCEICYQWSRSVGVSLARNTAIRIARYDLLALTDDDVLVAPDWLSELIHALLDAGPRCVVSGRVLVTETPEGDFAPSLKTDEAPAVYQGRIWKDALWSINMAMHRSAVGEVGFFDERLGPGSSLHDGDDNDYGFRILEAGYQIHYRPSALVYHKAWRPEKEFLPLRWKYGVGRGAFFAKHLNWHDGHMLRRMGRDIARLRYFPYRLWHERRKAYGDVVLVSGILFGAAKWLLTQPRTG